MTSLAISPDGRWIASATEESIRLSPMPDVTKLPLHTLPHAELMAKLDALTNLRVVRDATSFTGWKCRTRPKRTFPALIEAGSARIMSRRSLARHRCASDVRPH